MTSAGTFLRPSRAPKGTGVPRLLCVFDGGDAPGYSSIAVALTEEGNRRGFEVWAATEGFRSVTGDTTTELRFERLVVSRSERYALLGQGIPTRSMGRRVLDPGSDFRSERYTGFFEKEKRDAAAHAFHAQGFTHLVTIGGNGTLEGTKAWMESFAALPSGEGTPPTAFVNVSVDNDVGGDRAIGFLSGVEAGATIARGLYEDSYTHKRIYLLEMMGNRSGRHALHCGVASRAHLIVLPFFKFPDEVIREAAEALEKSEHALVVVAEGYERERRKKMGIELGASAFLKMQLEQYGLRDQPTRRVIAEPFSRYLRGVRPGFSDVSAAYLKVSLLFDAFANGRTQVMPFVLAGHDVGVRAFDQIVREDRVERAFLPLLDRFGLGRFQAWVKDNFTSEERAL
jgi:6-phosphofructokinase